MKKYFIVLSLFVLSACGGGSGGGNDVSGGQNVMRPSVTPTENQVRTSNLVVSSNIDNESKRSAHVINMLGEDYYTDISNGTVTAARASRPPMSNNKDYCSNPRECNDVAFNNMKKWLIDNISEFDNWTDNKELRNALKLAGFGNYLHGNWDDIKDWARDNWARIRNQAQDIYSDIGEHQDFDITKSDLSVISHMDGDAKVKFVFGKNKEISGIEYIVTHAPGVVSTLIADRIDSNDTKFKMDTKLYSYTLGGIGIKYDPASAVDGGREITLVSDKPLNLTEAQNKLKKLIAYYKEQGGFFDTFHSWPAENGEYEGDMQTAIVNALYAEVLEQINDLQSIEDLEFAEEEINTTVDFQSVGKNLGLAYSDFGIVQIDGDNEIFHGGYPDNKVELATIRDLNKEINFKGNAVGIVEKSTESGNTSQTTGKLDLTGTADLVVANNGKETLTVNFDKWYDVTVERNTDSNSITFANYHDAEDSFKFKRVNVDDELVNRDSNAAYVVENFTTIQTPHFSDADPTVTGRTEGSMVLDYFGSTSNNPTEFSGMVMYHENVPYNQNAGHYDNVDGVHFMMGFGGKKEY